MTGPKYKVGDIVTVHLSKKYRHPYGIGYNMKSLQGKKMIIINVDKWDVEKIDSPLWNAHDGYLYTLKESYMSWSSSMFAETYEY